MGYPYLNGGPLFDLSNPFLSALANVTSETTCLAEPDGDEMVYLARFAGAHFVPLHMPIGSRIPMYCTASGRAYLSALCDGEARALIERANRVQLTPKTKTSVEDFLKELRLTRSRGYALNDEVMFHGDMTAASPIVGRVADHAGPRWSLCVGAALGFAAAVVAAYALRRQVHRPRQCHLEGHGLP